MSVQQYLPVGSVIRRPDARPLVDTDVVALVASIKELGLLNPISCRVVGDGYEVIAGSNRLEAMTRLGETEILATILDLDDDHAELAMIDENLCRAELNPADRAAQMARRKAIYERLYPTAKSGASQAAGMNRAVGNVADNLSTTSFADATADATGRDARSVRRDAERGEKIEPAVLATISASEAKHLKTGAYLDELKAVPREEQAGKVERDKVAPPAPRNKKLSASVMEAADRAEATAEAKRKREAAQAENERVRDEARAALPDDIKSREAAKDARSRPAQLLADVLDTWSEQTVDALKAEIDELREANAALEADLAAARAENASYTDMKVEWEKGGYAEVVDGLKLRLAVLGRQVETESADKESWSRSSKLWMKRAREAGYSSEEVIDLREGARG